MRQLLKNVYRPFSHFYYQLGAFIMMLFVSLQVSADIPSAPNLPGGNTSDPISEAAAVFKEGATTGDLVMYVVAGFVYIGVLIAAFIFARKHKEWGQFALIAIVGAALEVIALVVLNQIKTALGS